MGARARPDYSRWTRITAQATLAYLQLVEPRVPIISTAIGNFLDTVLATISLTSGSHDLREAFAAFATRLWAVAQQSLQTALQQPTGYFRDD